MQHIHHSVSLLLVSTACATGLTAASAGVAMQHDKRAKLPGLIEKMRLCSI